MKAPARHSLNQSRRVLYRFGAALFLSISCLGHVRAACHAIWASMSPTRTGPARTDNAGGAPVVHSEKVHTQNRKSQYKVTLIFVSLRGPI